MPRVDLDLAVEEEKELERRAIQAEVVEAEQKRRSRDFERIVLEQSDPLAKLNGKAIRAVSMSSIQTEEISWLWYPRIPRRKVTLIEGDPGLGKSWITLAIATAVTLGKGLPDCELIEPGNVLLLSAEDGLGDTVKPRLETLGADVSRVFAIDKPITLDWTGCKDLHRLIGEHSPSVVIIDPLFAL